jgi:signal transduction histidine kinase
VLNHINEGIRSDAKVINMVGQIRGSIQKATKEALVGISWEGSRQVIDSNFAYLKAQEIRNFSEDAIKQFDQLQREWESLKSLFGEHGGQPERIRSIVKMSDTVWETADRTVKLIELYSDEKHAELEYIYLIFMLEIIMVIIVIVFLSRLVKSKREQEHLLLQQSKYAAMGEMLSMVAHQWRQPLASIAAVGARMRIDLELDEIEPERMKKKLDEIMEMTQHLSETINDFRNFFRPDRAKEEIDLAPLMQTVKELLQPSQKQAGIHCSIELQEGLVVLAFPRELQQVIINIVNNARDALSEIDGPRLITVRTREVETWVELSICNNGPHIPLQYLPRIFEPYFSSKDERNGTGLGLYMAKMIIEQHMGGHIRALNTDEGVCFRILLKRVQESAPA